MKTAIEGLKFKFGRQVRGHRQLRSISQTQLGEILGCSRVTIANIENAKCSPSLELAFKIASELSFSMDALKEGTTHYIRYSSIPDLRRLRTDDR